jgi:glycosyltransferase involved in cell wall biosynthesis
MSKSVSFKSKPGDSVATLSVVMPVHNALPHLDEAVASILHQSFADFEFVILDDASTDGSTDRLRDWAKIDNRIRLLTVDKNLGPVRSSNFVASAATAPLVARMDADDISCPNRLREQLELMTADPRIGVVASVCDMIDASGAKTRDAEVWRLWRRSIFVPFAHGAMMYRRAIFERVGGYRIECEYWEDQDLIVRMAAEAAIVVIPRTLYRVRQSMSSTRVLSSQERLEQALSKAYATLDKLTNCNSPDPAGSPSNSGKIDPRVFIATGSVHLWAGERPRLFLRMLSHANLSWNVGSASALIWTAWASLSPSTLRSFLKLLLRVRNRLALRQLSPSKAYLWEPLQKAKVYERAASEKLSAA